MAAQKSLPPFLLCVKSENYPASLEVRKLYQMIPNPLAAARHFIRVIDESGEDYLYPQDYFVPLRLPKAVANLLPVSDGSQPAS